METRAVRSRSYQARRGAIDLDETVDAGPATSFADLYARHRDAVFRLVRRHAGHDDEAADLAAGAFERAFRRFETYDPRRGPVLPWLLRIARNHAIDASRRQRPVVGLVDVTSGSGAAWSGAGPAGVSVTRDDARVGDCGAQGKAC